MSIKTLAQDWQRHASTPISTTEYTIHPTLETAARLHALAEMYPGRTIEQITTELLAAALEDFEQHLPYQQGDSIIAEDDHGDPIYEDIGDTPRFHELSKQHLLRLQK